jgi:hypothetical protein
MVAAPRFADTGGVKPLPNAATPMPAFQARILPFPQATPAREPRFVWLLAAVAATAVLLRAWRIGAGLPDFLEEAFPLRLALGMKDAATGRVDWNPHFFNYPSLSIYLHFAVQQAVFAMGLVTGAWKSWADYLVLFQIDPTPMVLAARSVGVACDALTIVAAGMLAERLHRGAGFIAALLCALAPILIETSRSVFCDTLMAALALWALERTLAYLRDGNARTLHVAALLVGLAAGAKYPAAALGAALAVALVMREGRSGLRRLPIVFALMAAAFVMTTPFAVLDVPAFLRDFRFESAHAAEGHLGTVGRHAFGYHLGNLLANLGPVAMVAVVAAPLVAWRRPDLRGAFAVLGIGLVAFALPISLAEIEAARYLAPVIAIAAVLAAATAFALTSAIPARFRQVATAALALAMLVPAGFAGWRAASTGADSTHRLAKEWCTAHLGPDDLLIEESYGAPLRTRVNLERFTATPEFQSASPEVRRRVLELPAVRVVAIPFGASGGATATVEPPGGQPATLDVFAHASEMNGTFYDPRLLGYADYAITSSAVRARYEADPARYPAPLAAYRLLDTHAEMVARFTPAGAVSGADIAVYRITPEFRRAAGGELDPLWWAAGVPAGFRARAAALLGEPDAVEARRADGAASGWVRSLDDLYAARLLDFADRLMMELAALRRDAAAAAVARGTLEALPAQVPASLVASLSLRRLGRAREALETVERTRSILGSTHGDPALELERARALLDLGERSAARAALTSLVGTLDPNDPIAAEARRLLATGP